MSIEEHVSFIFDNAIRQRLDESQPIIWRCKQFVLNRLAILRNNPLDARRSSCRKLFERSTDICPLGEHECA